MSEDQKNTNTVTEFNSVKTEYDENPLLSINKITIAPNNTPENSPSNILKHEPSPSRQDTGLIHSGIHDLSTSSPSTTTSSATTTNITNSPLVAPPPPPQRSMIVMNENGNNNNFTAHKGGNFFVRSISKDGNKKNNGGGGADNNNTHNNKDNSIEVKTTNNNNNNNNNKQDNDSNYNSKIISENNTIMDDNHTNQHNNSMNTNKNNPNDILKQNNSSTLEDHSSQQNSNTKRRNTVIASDLHFDSTKTRTDPNVKLEQSTLKMSSWMHSKYDDNEYSLNENNKSKNDSNEKKTPPSSSVSTAVITTSRSSDLVPSSSDSQYPSNILRNKNNPSSNDGLLTENSNKLSRDAFLVSSNNDALTSPKLPKLNSFGKLEEERSRLNSSGSNDLSHYHEQFVTSSVDQSRIPTGKHHQQIPANFILNNNRPTTKPDLPSSAPTDTLSQTPTSQPKIINSKFDGLRTRLLNNPKINKPRRHSEEEDVMGNAAAVLSNMRSSPFKFGDKTLPPLNSLTVATATNTATSTTTDTVLPRPHSASFSSRGSHSYTRPRVVIHGAEIDPKDTENALSQSSTDDEKLKNDPHEIYDNKSKDEYIQEPVNWNKNGKRVSTTHIDSDKIKHIKNDPKYVLIASAKPPPQQNESTKDPYGLNLKKGQKKVRMEPLSPEVLKANTSGARNSFRVISNGQSGKVGPTGTRSRTGCWICRLRKKKCTEEKPSCINCSRLNLTCYYDERRPDFVSDPVKKAEKLLEIKKYTREAKKNAMRKRTYIQSPTESETSSGAVQ